MAQQKCFLWRCYANHALLILHTSFAYLGNTIHAYKLKTHTMKNKSTMSGKLIIVITKKAMTKNDKKWYICWRLTDLVVRIYIWVLKVQVKHIEVNVYDISREFFHSYIIWCISWEVWTLCKSQNLKLKHGYIHWFYSLILFSGFCHIW